MGIGVWQVVLILVVVLIIFGAGKLPRVAGDLAKGIKNFKSGMKEGDGAETATAQNATADTKPVSDQSASEVHTADELAAKDAIKVKK